MSRFRFDDGEPATIPIALLCCVLGVSRAGYSAWRERAALRAAGTRVDRKRVARLRRDDGLVGVVRRSRFFRTTIADTTLPVAPNRVARDITATAPDRLWVGGTTYVPTGDGWPYLAILLDAHARRVVG